MKLAQAEDRLKILGEGSERPRREPRFHRAIKLKNAQARLLFTNTQSQNQALEKLLAELEGEQGFDREGHHD